MTASFPAALQTSEQRVEQGDLKAMIAELPSLESMDGVYFLAIPVCGEARFALSLSKDGRGSLVIADLRNNSDRGPVTKRQGFNVSPSIAASVLAEFDKLARPWPGDAEFVIHGTEVTFERKRYGQVFSGSDNTSGYAGLASAVRAKLLPYAPELAKDKMWHSPGC